MVDVGVQVATEPAAFEDAVTVPEFEAYELRLTETVIVAEVPALSPETMMGRLLPLPTPTDTEPAETVTEYVFEAE